METRGGGAGVGMEGSMDGRGRKEILTEDIFLTLGCK